MRYAIRHAICLAATMACVPGHASVLDIFGFDPRAMSMGNAQTAIADDFTATFYNPANLSRRKRIVAGAGFLGALPRLTIDRDLEDSAIGSRLPENFAGITIGALFPLGSGIDERIALGFAVYLPAGQLAEGDIADARVPQFYRYQNLPDKFVVLGGLGFQITDWLHIGGGAQVLAALQGGIAFDIALADRTVHSESIGVDVELVAAPVLGLSVGPLAGLTVGFSWRDDIALDYALPGDIVIDDLVRLFLDLQGTVLYTPASYNIGVAYAIEQAGLLLGAEFSYVRWSLAPDPSIGIAIDIDGTLLDGLGLEERIDIANGAPVELAFRDVGVWRLGGELQLNDNLAARAGYTWRPSPAPVPTQAFNYIDGDAHVLGAGLGLTFHNPLEEHGNPAHIDVAYQLTIMDEVAVDKAATDPVGDYRAGGLVHAISVAFRHEM